MLPEGWKRVPLEQIAKVTSGGTPNRANPTYWNGNVPWVTTGEIRFNTITNTDEKITEAGLANSSTKLFPPGTLLVAMYGQGKTRGQVARLGISAATNQACAALLLEGDNDPAFFFQVLASKYEEIRELGNAGTQKNLNGEIIKQLLVPVPPPAEQFGIAQALDNWDKAIATSERLLANNRTQRNALADSLLSGRRRFKHQLPWQPRPISELIAESRVSGSGGDQARKLTVKLYGKGVIAKSEKRAGSESTQYYRRSRGQFIYSKLDFLNGAFGLIPDELDGYESTLDLPAFDFQSGVDPRWFLHFISREAFYSEQLGLANGGRKARRVNPSDLGQVVINVPSIEEQRAIAKAIDLADQIIRANERELALLRAEKSALMEQLLTGKRRLRAPSAPDQQPATNNQQP